MHRFVRILCIFASLTLIGIGLFSSEGISDIRWLALLAVAWVFLLIGTYIPLDDVLPTFNRSIIRTAVVFSTMFAVISAQLVRIQVVQSDATFNKTAEAPDGETIANPRKSSNDLLSARGKMFDRNGELVADTVRKGGVYLRRYPNPTTAYVAGYYSPLLYGSSGLEERFNDELTGQTSTNPLERTLNNLLNRPQSALDLQLTLDSHLQQNATDLLSGRKGAVVVLDAKSGAVVVLASTPSFDPEKLFTSSSEQNVAASSYWTSLTESPDAPLVLRANLGLYTPGSTFKTVTAAAAIDSGVAKPDDVYQDNGSLDIDGRTLVENNRPDPSRSEWTLTEGFAWSLNVVFAQIGLKIGADRLANYASRFGFGSDIPFDLTVSRSQLTSSPDFLRSMNALADTAFGQGQILVTPLQMAMIAATFANGGSMMQPYLVSSVTDDNESTRLKTMPKTWKTPVTVATAMSLKTLMINAVENGAVQAAITPGYVVGGKTGTAETGNGAVHSWFIGFIGAPEPAYAVSVVLEEGSNALGTSVNIGQAILNATILSFS
jgi:peptidoglycan glycosyltransferase